MKKIFIVVLACMFATNLVSFAAEKDLSVNKDAVKENTVPKVENTKQDKTETKAKGNGKDVSKLDNAKVSPNAGSANDKIKDTAESAKEKTVEGVKDTSTQNVKSTKKVTPSNIEILTKKGFFDKGQNKKQNISPFEEIKKTFQSHYKYSNSHDINGLSSMYADNYMSEDGFNKDIYFELVKKTWESYPQISYKLNIKDIIINGNTAVVQVNECALSQTPARSDIVNQTGLLKSFSETVYYLEKIGNKWLVVTDRVLYEKTFLQYGSAKLMNVNLIAPSQVQAGNSYTATLKINPDKSSFVIASIGQELVTYPQATAKEVFRKLSNDGTLERMFTANSKNINEYAVASYGITKAEVKDGKEIKISVTGIGFIMQKINVVPKNNYVKVNNEKAK